MAGKHHEIAIEGLNIHRAVADRLAAVEHDPGAGVVGHADHLGGGRDDAERVGHLCESHQLHRTVEQAAIGLHVDLAVVEDGNRLDHEPSLGCQQVPRHDVRVVLESRDQDPVAFLEVRPAPGLRYQVDALGAAAHEDHFPVFRGIDEAADRIPCLLEPLGRGLGEPVHAAMDICVLLLVEAAFGVDHLARLLGAGGAVEIDQRAPAHLAREYGKVGAHQRGVEGDVVCGEGCGHRHARVLQAMA